VVQGRWTDEEHEKFLAAIREYGKDWAMVETVIGTRNSN
jgi:SHAQKYF class myb-like DNA-binding protein